MIGNILAGGAALAAIASIIVALRTYREQVRSRQTQWLLDLRHRLLENERFRLLRADIVGQLSRSGSNDYSTTMAKAIKKKRSADTAEASTLTDVEIERLGMVAEYLNFFGILEHLIADKRLRERDVFVAFNGEVDTIGRVDVLALELVDYPSTVRLIERHRRIFEELYPHLVGTPRATVI